MKMKGLFKVMATLVTVNAVYALVRTTPPPTAPAAFAWTWTTALPGKNLNGKMMTLTPNKGTAAFFPPYYEDPNNTPSYPRPTTWPYQYPTRDYPRPTTRPYPYTTSRYPTTTRPYPYPIRHHPKPTTRPYPYTTRGYHPHYWTTAPPTPGVSVCVRYLTDFAQQSETPLFTLSPSRGPLKMSVNKLGVYIVSTDPYSYYKQSMKPIVRLWPDVGPDMWSRVCLTVDSTKNVVQVFSGANMSIRRIMSWRYAWTGEPVIDFTGFDGQITDLQMWNYPLRYKEIFSYMAGGFYGPYRGNVLTWAGINYSVRGNALLEDSYGRQVKARDVKTRTQGRPKGQKKSEWIAKEENQTL